MNKKHLLAFFTATVLLLTLAGCTGTKEPGESNMPSATVAGTVNTDGSTSMEKVVKALGEAFSTEYPSVTVNYNGSGSGAGVESVLNGSTDLGLASRSLKEEETASGAVAHVVALDGVVIVVNPENTVSDLTVEQIAGIYTGEIKNWSEVGGADMAIAAYGREAGSGTRSAFEEIVGIKDACRYANEYSSTGDVIGAVSNNPNAIGYASLAAVNDTVKALKVGGVACTEETVRSGEYAIQRPFVIITKEDVTLSTAAEAFLSYALSAEAAPVITAAGVVPANG
ncbi:MAG: phosphate ABC transporter substrate-binding protein [Oscillospiraceae bacterium]|nr:phosphate ABC transporter substrate-binding protein [Oscillospiraceae bacterium]